MNDEAGFAGRRPRRRPTTRIVAGSKEHGQLEKREPYRHSVGTCERCHSRIEPLISLQWWCEMDELARAGDRGAARAAGPLPPREPAPVRDRVARAGARLVRLAAALVGSPDPDLVLPRRAPHRARGRRRRRAPSAARPSSSATRTSSTRGSRPRSGRSRRSAGPSRRRSSSATTRATSTSTAREIIRLWENRMIFAGPRPPRRGAVHGRDHHTRPCSHADGRRMSKSLGTGIDPMRADRGARRGRDPLRASQDLVDAGRPLLGRRDRGGAQAREQALERRAARPPTPRA